jgi:UDPglucose 6-dehydrogenase
MERMIVVGAGVVGSATGQALSTLGHDVSFVDISPQRVDRLIADQFNASTTLQIRGGEVVLVSVPTPSMGSGFDLSIMEEAIAGIGGAIATAAGLVTVVIRSTVPPGFCESVVIPLLAARSGKSLGEGFSVVSAPEFLREATALEDALHPWVLVVGSKDRDGAERVATAFSPLGGDVHLFPSTTAAEMVKIVHNCFNATKISFWNEIGMVCRAADVDANAVSAVVSKSAEASFNPNYGIRSGFPFGGACLPKDLDGLIGFANDASVQVPMLEAVRLVNHTMENLHL